MNSNNFIKQIIEFFNYDGSLREDKSFSSLITYDFHPYAQKMIEKHLKQKRIFKFQINHDYFLMGMSFWHEFTEKDLDWLERTMREKIRNNDNLVPINREDESSVAVAMPWVINKFHVYDTPFVMEDYVRLFYDHHKDFYDCCFIIDAIRILDLTPEVLEKTIDNFTDKDGVYTEIVKAMNEKGIQTKHSFMYEDGDVKSYGLHIDDCIVFAGCIFTNGRAAHRYANDNGIILHGVDVTDELHPDDFLRNLYD